MCQSAIKESNPPSTTRNFSLFIKICYAIGGAEKNGVPPSAPLFSPYDNRHKGFSFFRQRFPPASPSLFPFPFGARLRGNQKGRPPAMRERRPDTGRGPAAVSPLVQIVFLADAFLVVLIAPMQFFDAVHEPSAIPFLNGVDDEGVLLHGGQIPFAHEIFTRKVPQAVLDGREDALGEYVGRDFEKNAMEEVVETIIGNHVAAQDGLLHVRVQAAHFGYGGLAVVVDGAGDDGILQGPHNLVEEGEILRLQRIDDHLAARVDSQVAFRLKADERIPQGRIADAELAADGLKIEYAPRQEAPFPHLLPDVLIHHHPSRNGGRFFPGRGRRRLFSMFCACHTDSLAIFPDRAGLLRASRRTASERGTTLPPPRGPEKRGPVAGPFIPFFRKLYLFSYIKSNGS